MRTRALAVTLLLGSAAVAQTTVPSQSLPLVPRWSVALSAPPAGPSVIAADLLIVPISPSGVVAIRAADGANAWRADLAIDRPLLADAERAYVVSGGAIHALNLRTGDRLWRAETGTLTAAPLVHAGWVVVASAGHLSAFRASDGSQVWRRAIGAIEFPPAIDGDLLFVPLVDGRLAALDVRTGDVRWEITLGGAPGEPLAAYGEVYVGANDRHFYVIDASNHRIRWQQLIGAGPRGRAAVDDDHVYCVALDNVLRTFKRSSGARLWMHSLTYRPAAGPVLISGVVVVPGAVSTLPVFGRDGSRVKEITFPSPLAGFSNVIDGNSTHPTVGIVTGDLEHPWTVSMLEPSYDPPAIPIAELTVLPGATIEIAPPR